MRFRIGRKNKNLRASFCLLPLIGSSPFQELKTPPRFGFVTWPLQASAKEARVPRPGSASTRVGWPLLVSWHHSEAPPFVALVGSIHSRGLQEWHSLCQGLFSLETTQSCSGLEGVGVRKVKLNASVVVRKLGPRESPKVTPCLHHCLPDTKSLKGNKMS